MSGMKGVGASFVYSSERAQSSVQQSDRKLASSVVSVEHSKKERRSFSRFFRPLKFKSKRSENVVVISRSNDGGVTVTTHKRKIFSDQSECGSPMQAFSLEEFVSLSTGVSNSNNSAQMSPAPPSAQPSTLKRPTQPPPAPPSAQPSTLKRPTQPPPAPPSAQPSTLKRPTQPPPAPPSAQPSTLKRPTQPPPSAKFVGSERFIVPSHAEASPLSNGVDDLPPPPPVESLSPEIADVPLPPPPPELVSQPSVQSEPTKPLGVSPSVQPSSPPHGAGSAQQKTGTSIDEGRSSLLSQISQFKTPDAVLNSLKKVTPQDGKNNSGAAVQGPQVKGASQVGMGELLSQALAKRRVAYGLDDEHKLDEGEAQDDDVPPLESDADEVTRL